MRTAPDGEDRLRAAARELGQTQSLCPVCLRRIPARRVARGDDVHLEKRCPAHGPFRTIIWRGPPRFEAWGAGRPYPPADAPRAGPGCPFECGLCPDHRRRTCCALLEVTRRCNLACRYCFAQSGGPGDDPDLDAIARGYRQLLEGGGGPVNVQLSGGEPTLRDDLPEIIRLGRSLGFTFFQLNTNGLRLASDAGYVRALAAAGLSCAFLQFDGVSDAVHQRTRGRALRAVKEAAVARCAEHGIGVVLVPTVVPGVNDGELGAIVELALRWAPGVRGVHFQPVSYFGRYPEPPSDASRITLPEVMRALEAQTGGLVRCQDLHPPSAENAHCSFSGSFFRTAEGRLAVRPPAATPGCCSRPGPADEVRRSREYVARRWALPAAAARPDSCCGGDKDALDAIIERAGRDSFCISGMAFQDAWNVDLERLRDCFIHVAGGGAGLVPFCAYNLTDQAGQALHRRGPA